MTYWWRVTKTSGAVAYLTAYQITRERLEADKAAGIIADFARISEAQVVAEVTR